MRPLLRAFERFEQWLAGWPDGYLTLALLLAAGVFVLIALHGRPMTKAAALAYAVLP